MEPCGICGLAVMDMAEHDRWHDEQDGKVRLTHPVLGEQVRVSELAKPYFIEKGWQELTQA